MPRGRLICPFLAEVARLDTAATSDDPDGSGPILGGMDPIFREPVKVPTDSDDEIGTTNRVELPVVQIPVQIEAEQFDRLQMLANGLSPRGVIRLIAHFRDLETMGLVHPDGSAAFDTDDRLVRILRKDGVLVQEFTGLYLTQAIPRGWGLSTSVPKRNLLFLDFMSRDQGLQ